MIERIQEILQLLSITTGMQVQLLLSVFLAVVLWVARFVVHRLLYGRFYHKPQSLYTWRKATDYVVVVLAVFLIGRLWLEGVQSLATYLGLLSAGLAIALQDLLVNLAGWVYIVWRRPFQMGDRIEIGNHSGDVLDIGLFETALLEVSKRINAEQSTGRIIHIPNGLVFREPLANFNQGLPFIWNEIPVLITFESDWEKAKQILQEIVTRYAPNVQKVAQSYFRQPDRRFLISHNRVTPTVYTEVAASGVRLTLRYLVHPRERRDSEQTMWEAILRTFAQHWDIDFAYETQREYVHWRERKRPPQQTADFPTPPDPTITPTPDKPTNRKDL